LLVGSHHRSSYVGTRFTTIDSRRFDESRPIQLSVNTVRPLRGADVLPAPDDVPVQLSPFDPLTEHDDAFETFHVTNTVEFGRMRRGCTCRCPEGGGTRHVGAPSEQKDGAVHVVTSDVTQDVLVYRMVCPEHEYDAAQVNVTVAFALEVPFPPVHVTV
jgi:hypothetical protein